MPDDRKSKTFAERALQGLARGDSSGSLRYFMLLAGAAREFLGGDRMTAGKYLSSLIEISKHDASARLPFPRTSYHERLTDSEARAWLGSALKLVRYTFPAWDDSLLVACADDGELFGEFQIAGFSKLAGVDLREEEASTPNEGEAAGSTASLDQIQRTYRTVTLINVLEYLNAEQAETLLKRLQHVADDYVVASIPIYPDDWLEFFRVDSSRVTLQTRDWWNQLFSRSGFEVAETPAEALPFVRPFVFRKRRLQLYAKSERETPLTETLSAQYNEGLSPKAAFVVPDD